MERHSGPALRRTIVTVSIGAVLAGITVGAVSPATAADPTPEVTTATAPR